ncbi:signal peptidase I [Catalinimonas alkaloidigena]|uniref:Signal peptidase I n=1 Tax=Catalinimonas alkaloidigena TaxID=1075417 RepID=A0A1G9S2P1_9BACT|nr:signal peptidase I [Catalinimonas alkaloidigena]SDM29682.1 signal peptidase I [Catalinimonas alkaloidigena]
MARKPKSSAREWTEAILFAVVAATLIRWLFLEAFTIPSPSMEKTLLVGDFLFVSKIHYGARTPQTPLQVPLTHQTLWGTDQPSYSTRLQWPMFRLPGISHVQRNDVVVFNFPPELDHPVDLKTHYIKRCLAVGGDTLQIRNRQVYINGEAAPNPTEMQFSYLLEVGTVELKPAFFKQWDIREWQRVPGGFKIYTTPAIADSLRNEAQVKRLEPLEEQPGVADNYVFPNAAALFPWNQDNFGPLWIPAEGGTLPMTKENVALYGETIRRYEHLRKVELKDNQLLIDGAPVQEYTFRQNYYFMMGDNRHNSLDSRYWGFVPEDHIVGKAIFIWMSMERENKGTDGVRWNRIFQAIR